ncbi:DNA-processing protein DprA [Massilia terrae]|uniref:DNA-processing protein DprA n=1 Tax=Massilia terrae TaxID=1811224 RepID=UPI00351D0C90
MGCRTANLLLAEFGSPRAIVEAGVKELSAHVSKAQASALCAPDSPAFSALLAATLDWLKRPGHHLITRHDQRYPALLAQIPDPPLMLYAIGEPGLLAQPCLAIVGSRNASAQGRANAEAFAQALSDGGLTIVSGLAAGIDASAHIGALRGGASTIAVVGTGLDRVYPARHRELAQCIARQGCMLSEYALGTGPIANNFPRRNRIISGLAAGVLVVEAAAESGSLITAGLANDQGREVFAVPGSIHSALSKGCHKLIRDGALLVETANDVLQAMHMSPLAAVAPAMPNDGACDQLLGRIGFDPVCFDALASHTGAPAASLASQLLLLELAGQLERLPGNIIQRIVR